MRNLGAIALLFFLAACITAQGASPSGGVTNSINSGDSTNQNSSDPIIEFPTMIPNQYSPKANDDKKIRGPFFMDSYNLNIMESYPIQISLSVSGSLPTPCHEFRVEILQPDELNQINIEMYSVMDPEKMCAQVIVPFEFTIPMGSYPTNHYSVWINGSQVGDFDS